MRYLLSFLTAIMISPVFADTIGDIEYYLPLERQDWNKVKSIEEEENDDGAKCYTFLYAPKEDSLDDPIEFFASHVNNAPSAGTSPKEVKEGLEEAFDGKINVVIIESDADSTLYEWSILDDGQFVYSLARGFFSEAGTTLLMYQTTQKDRVEAEKTLWMETLKSAKKI